MAMSWAWLHQSNFQLISIALPGFRPAKIKVVPSSAHKQHLKQEEGPSGRMRQKEKSGFMEMKDWSSDNLEKTISEPIFYKITVLAHALYSISCQPCQDFSRMMTTIPSEKRVMPTWTSLAGA